MGKLLVLKYLILIFQEIKLNYNHTILRIVIIKYSKHLVQIKGQRKNLQIREINKIRIILIQIKIMKI